MVWYECTCHAFYCSLFTMDMWGPLGEDGPWAKMDPRQNNRPKGNL